MWQWSVYNKSPLVCKVLDQVAMQKGFIISATCPFYHSRVVQPSFWHFVPHYYWNLWELNNHCFRFQNQLSWEILHLKCFRQSFPEVDQRPAEMSEVLTANETRTDEKPAHKDKGYFMQFGYTLKNTVQFSQNGCWSYINYPLEKKNYQRLISFNPVEGKILVL